MPSNSLFCVCPCGQVEVCLRKLREHQDTKCGNVITYEMDNRRWRELTRKLQKEHSMPRELPSTCLGSCGRRLLGDDRTRGSGHRDTDRRPRRDREADWEQTLKRRHVELRRHLAELKDASHYLRDNVRDIDWELATITLRQVQHERMENLIKN